MVSTDFIQFDNLNGLRIVEVTKRRVDKREMPILSDSEYSKVRRILSQKFGVVPQEVERNATEVDAVGKWRPALQVFSRDLPARSRDEVSASVATAGTLRSTIDEFAQASASVREAAALHDLGDKPLVVLTAGAGKPS